MPAAALADSQYRRGTARVSKTADNEDTTAALGDSEPARVQYAVGPPVPEVAQPPEDGRHVPSPVGTKQSGNILNEAPPWPQFGQDASELKPETAALAPKTGPCAGHAEILAGESAVDEVNSTGGVASPPVLCSQPFSVGVGAVSDSDQVSASSAKCGRVHLANVCDSLDIRPVPFQNAETPRVGLSLQHGPDACSL
jgi:hypothetical protein